MSHHSDVVWRFSLTNTMTLSDLLSVIANKMSRQASRHAVTETSQALMCMHCYNLCDFDVYALMCMHGLDQRAMHCFDAYAGIALIS